MDFDDDVRAAPRAGRPLRVAVCGNAARAFRDERERGCRKRTVESGRRGLPPWSRHGVG